MQHTPKATKTSNYRTQYENKKKKTIWYITCSTCRLYIQIIWAANLVRIISCWHDCHTFVTCFMNIYHPFQLISEIVDGILLAKSLKNSYES